MGRLPRKIAMKFALLALVGCSGEGADAPGEQQTPAGFGSAWAEFLGPDEISASLPLLRAHSVSVNVAWPAADIASPERFALVEEARAAGVEVRPWLLLDEADGYWPGSSNATKFADVAIQLMDAWAARGLPPMTLVVDMELRKDRADELSLLLTSDLPAAVEFLKDGVDVVAYQSASVTYRDLVNTAHERGHRVHLTTLPQVIDDYTDGDDGVRQAFGIPVDGIEWDSMSFQAYRTLFGDLLGGQPSSYFVFAYGVEARALFGERAGLDIGLVGQGVTESSVYASGADLAADLAASRAAGIPRERVFVYNLDGILGRAPSEQWWLTSGPDAVPPPEDEATVSIRTKVAVLDLVL